jgi:ABC-type glycerol-3-phosphate transport system substrate-binding protein
MKSDTSWNKFVRFFSAVCFFAVLTVPAFSDPLEIEVNDLTRRRFSELDFERLSYPVPREDRLVEAVSLLEAAPLMAEAYRVEINTRRNGAETLTGNLADRFARWYLFREGGEWTLETREMPADSADGGSYTGVTKISVAGELLEADTLTVWVSWEGTDLLEEEIERFSALSGMEIAVLEVPRIQSKLTSVARGGGDLPDLVMVQSDYLPELIGGKVIQRLDYIPADHLLDKGSYAFSRDGGRWALPFYFDTQLVFYRPDITGPLPENRWALDEFESILEDIRSRGTAPITWNAYSAYWLIPFQIAFGKERLLEPDGRIVIDDEPTRKALEYLVSLMDLGLLDVREREGMISRFVEGDVAMILTGSYSIPSFEELGLAFAVHPYPYNTRTGNSVSPLLDFKGWAMTRKTKNPVLARRLIEYLTGVGAQYRFTEAVFKLPANREAWAVAETANPYFDELEAGYEAGTVIPPNDVYPIFKNTMWKLLRFVFSGQMSIDAVLDQGQAIIDKKFQRRKR